MAVTEKAGDTSQQRSKQMVVVAGSGVLQQALHHADGTSALQIDHRWQCEPIDALSRLEDAVYEEQSLFDDLDTTLLLRPTVSTIVPRALLSPDDSDAIRAVMDHYDPTEAKDCFTEPIGDDDDNLLLYSMPAGIRGFLERSFPTEDIRHALLPMLQYFCSTAATIKGDCMWADVQTSRVDVIAFRSGHLLHANSWKFREPEDAAYYIAYTWQTLGLDTETGQLSISGKTSLRNAIVPTLRRHINYVTMATIPQTVKEANASGVPLCAALTLHNRHSTTCE